MDRVASDFTSHRNVMTFMSGQSIGIRYGYHLLISIGDHDHAGAFLDAFLRAFGGLGVRALGSALGVGDVSLDCGGIAGERNPTEHEHNRERSTDK